MKKVAKIISIFTSLLVIMSLFTGCNSNDEKELQEILNKINQNCSYDFNMDTDMDIKLKSGTNTQDKQKIEEISKGLKNNKLNIKGSIAIKNGSEGDFYVKQESNTKEKKSTALEGWMKLRKDNDKIILNIKPFKDMYNVMMIPQMKEQIDKILAKKQYLTQDYTREALKNADISTVLLSCEIEDMKKSIVENNFYKLKFKENMVKKQENKKINVNDKEVTATLYCINVSKNKIKELLDTNSEFYKNNKTVLESMKKQYQNKILQNFMLKKEELSVFKDFNFIGDDGIKVEYYAVDGNLMKTKVAMDLQIGMDLMNKLLKNTTDSKKKSNSIVEFKINMNTDTFNHGKAKVNIPECNSNNSIKLTEFQKVMGQLMYGNK